MSCHEFQHSIVEQNRRYLDGEIICQAGEYHLPPGPGLGVRPSAEALRNLEQ